MDADESVVMDLSQVKGENRIFVLKGNITTIR